MASLIKTLEQSLLALEDGELFGQRFAVFSLNLLLRICPGTHIADASVWVNIAITLATCDLLLIEDDTFKKPLTPDRLYEAGAIRYAI
jgi:hypothetical protein